MDGGEGPSVAAGGGGHVDGGERGEGGAVDGLEGREEAGAGAREGEAQRREDVRAVGGEGDGGAGGGGELGLLEDLGAGVRARRDGGPRGWGGAKGPT